MNKDNKWLNYLEKGEDVPLAVKRVKTTKATVVLPRSNKQRKAVKP